MGRLFGRKGAKALRKGAESAEKTAGSTVDAVATPSPNPMTNAVIADIALRAGGALLRRGVETGILGRSLGDRKAGRVVKGRGMVGTLVSTALARVATRSVPGAIVVGGGLLAKTLYERRHARKAKAKGAADIAERAAKGKAEEA